MIIWGTKRVEKTLGRAADFCPMCRTLRSFRMKKISMVSHIYFVGLGRGQSVGHIGTCETCGFEMDVDVTAYAALAKARSKTDTRELAQETFPDIQKAYANRLELENQLRASPASVEPAVRQELLREVLQNVAPAVEQRYAGGTQLDWRAGIALLAALLGPVAILMIGHDLVPETTYSSVIKPLALVALLGGLAATFFFGATANGRWMRTNILPMLTRAFRPLQPTERELDQLLAKFRTADLKIGKKLKSQMVCRPLEQARMGTIG